MTKLLFTLGVITAGLSLGCGFQMAVAAGRLRLPLPLADLRRLLQKVGLLCFMYFSFMATVWIIRIDNLRLAALPAIGLFILLFGGVLALGFARVLKMTRKQTGSYFACGSFSIYDLDLDLSNACWLTSTLALFGVLPAVYVLIQQM